MLSFSKRHTAGMLSNAYQPDGLHRCTVPSCCCLCLLRSGFGMCSECFRHPFGGGGERRTGMGWEMDKAEGIERLERRRCGKSRRAEERNGGWRDVGEAFLTVLSFWISVVPPAAIRYICRRSFSSSFPPAAFRYICLRSSSSSCMLTAMLNVVVDPFCLMV